MTVLATQGRAGIAGHAIVVRLGISREDDPFNYTTTVLYVRYDKENSDDGKRAMLFEFIEFIGLRSHFSFFFFEEKLVEKCIYFSYY